MQVQKRKKNEEKREERGRKSKERSTK